MTKSMTRHLLLLFFHLLDSFPWCPFSVWCGAFLFGELGFLREQRDRCQVFGGFVAFSQENDVVLKMLRERDVLIATLLFWVFKIQLSASWRSSSAQNAFHLFISTYFVSFFSTTKIIALLLVLTKCFFYLFLLQVVSIAPYQSSFA